MMNNRRKKFWMSLWAAMMLLCFSVVAFAAGSYREPTTGAAYVFDSVNSKYRVCAGNDEGGWFLIAAVGTYEIDASKIEAKANTGSRLQGPCMSITQIPVNMFLFPVMN